MSVHEASHALDLTVELRQLQAALYELAATVAGDVISIPRRVVIDANRNPVDFAVNSDEAFHSVKIDNPTDVPVYVAFAAGQGGRADRFEEIVAARSGRVLTRPYDVVSIGIDPAQVPGAPVVLPVTYYARALPPTTYELHGGVATGGATLVDIGDNIGRLLGRVGGTYRATKPTLADLAAADFGLTNRGAQRTALEDSAGNYIDTPLLSAGLTGSERGLVVASAPLRFAGGTVYGFDRTPAVFKRLASTAIVAGTGITAWTPAAGKKFRLMGWLLSFSVAAQLIFGDNTVAAEIMRSEVLAAAGVSKLGNSDVGNGILSAAANNVLKIDASVGGNVAGMVWGTEE